jgi:biotin transport system substrate-specific component
VVGGALGAQLGAASLLLYIFEGSVGLPFFAGGESGWHGLFAPSAAFPSAGYLWGFVLAAALVGWLSRRGWDRSLRSSIGAMLLGEVVLYVVGLIWLAAALNIPLVDSDPFAACRFPSLAGCDSFQLGLYPFVIGDVLKLMLAATVLPTAWRLIGRRGDS